jgi:hypothetical protein
MVRLRKNRALARTPRRSVVPAVDRVGRVAREAGVLQVAAAVGVPHPVEPGETPPNPDDDGVLCTMDAKICPDGSPIGRSDPDCEFNPCPAGGDYAETDDTEPDSDGPDSDDDDEL